MAYGLWFMVHDLEFGVKGVGIARSSAGSGPAGLWFMVNGLWFMIDGLWFMV